MSSNPKQGKEEILGYNFPQHRYIYFRMTYFSLMTNKGDHQMLFQYDPSISALIIDIFIFLVGSAIYFFSIGVIVAKWHAGTKGWNDSWGTAIILNLLWFVISGISFGIINIVILIFGVFSYYWLFIIISFIIYAILNTFVVMKLHDKEFVESLIFFFAVFLIISLVIIFGVYFIAFIIGVILGVVTLLGKLLVVLLGNSLLVFSN